MAEHNLVPLDCHQSEARNQLLNLGERPVLQERHLDEEVDLLRYLAAVNLFQHFLIFYLVDNGEQAIFRALDRRCPFFVVDECQFAEALPCVKLSDLNEPLHVLVSLQLLKLFVLGFGDVVPLSMLEVVDFVAFAAFEEGALARLGLLH